MEKDIIKCNKLICSFMGWMMYVDDGPIVLYYLPVDETKKYIHGCTVKHIAEMNYFTSWDWIIPVVQKIHETREYHDKYCTTYPNSLLEVVDIRIVHDNCVHFINWYNDIHEG